jgi:hypothetical protein
MSSSPRASSRSNSPRRDHDEDRKPRSDSRDRDAEDRKPEERGTIDARSGSPARNTEHKIAPEDEVVSA